MKLSIYTKELPKEKGKYIAMVDWHKHDGGKVGAPGCIQYGDSEEEANNNLKLLLEKKGHEVVTY